VKVGVVAVKVGVVAVPAVAGWEAARAVKVGVVAVAGWEATRAVKVGVEEEEQMGGNCSRPSSNIQGYEYVHRTAIQAMLWRSRVRSE
jgi:hypothetical protein